MSESVFKVTDATFEREVLEASNAMPVLVDFWAEWCGPCRRIAPVVDEVAAEFEGMAKVTKVDVDENPALASRFGIRGIPALLIFKSGNEVGRLIGARPKEDVAGALKKHLC